MNIDHKVAQLLVSRVCHDLAGGIAALSTGAELLSEDEGMADGAALNVIAMSARQSTSRLAFLRLAFGLGGGGDDTITTDELKTLMLNFIEGGRLSMVWAVDNVRIPLMASKLLLTLCLVGSEALPRGGVLHIDVSQIGGRLGFAVSAQGDGAKLRPGVESAMSIDANVDLLTVRTVHGYFAAILAHDLNAEMEIQAEEGGEIHLAALI